MNLTRGLRNVKTVLRALPSTEARRLVAEAWRLERRLPHWFESHSLPQLKQMLDGEAGARNRLASGRDTPVEPPSGECRGFIAVRSFDQVERLLPGHADHVASAAKDANTLTDQHLRVPPTDRGHVEVAIVIYVGDDKANLVDVPGKHHRRRAARVDHRDAVAGDVTADLGELPRVLAPYAGWARLEPRWAGSIEKLMKKRARVGGEHLSSRYELVDPESIPDRMRWALGDAAESATSRSVIDFEAGFLRSSAR